MAFMGGLMAVWGLEKRRSMLRLLVVTGAPYCHVAASKENIVHRLVSYPCLDCGLDSADLKPAQGVSTSFVFPALTIQVATDALPEL
jgi:hypothetical protein